MGSSEDQGLCKVRGLGFGREYMASLSYRSEVLYNYSVEPAVLLYMFRFQGLKV